MNGRIGSGRIGRRSKSGRAGGSRCAEVSTKKKTMSIDDIAMLAARVSRGERVSHPLANQAMGMACESVRRMVYGLALKYASTCRLEPDDLAQDCMKRIVQRIGDFDVKLAKFTTWSWTVSQSVLNGAYRKRLGWNEHIVGTDVDDLKGPLEPRTNPDESGALRMDILETIQELVRMYPRKKRLILGLFGNPNKTGFVMPSHVMMAKAAKNAGVACKTAKEFFIHVVRPFFLKQFSSAQEVQCPTQDIPEEPEVPPKSFGMRIADVALTILTSESRPLGARELYNKAIAQGLYASHAKNPYVSFFRTLRRDLERGETRICRTGPGIWEVAA